MRSSLTLTLFVCFTTLTAVVLIATLGLARWSFERGFLDYVVNLERARLERLGERLLDRYAADGNRWSGLDDAQFDELIGRQRPRHPPPPGKRPGERLGERPRGPRTALFDVNGEPLFGATLPVDIEDRVEHRLEWDGALVGTLRSSVRRSIESPGETAFSRQQLHRSIVIGAVALVLAGALSWWLSRRLLAPVRSSLASVARLSDGDYQAPPESVDVARHNELGRLASDIERLRSTLDDNRSSRRRLLADVSHELRTPLTILSGEIDALKDGLRPVDDAALLSLKQEALRLTRLVDDLFELALSDTGGLRYRFERLRLDTLLAQCVGGFQPLVDKAGLTLTHDIDAGLSITGDAKRLSQLFTNLLANAVAYTDAPGTIRLRARASPFGAVIHVEDSAPAPAQFDRLFESLYREDESRDRRSGGAGLGLAICRNIVHAHGGRIEASAAELGGLAMIVRLPVRAGDTWGET